MIQNELTKYVDFYNSFPRRKDRRTKLPTGCDANYCFQNPVEEFGGVQGLIPVPKEMLEEIEVMDYPERGILWSFTPDWFSEKVDEVMENLNYSYHSLHMSNIWDVFTAILVELKKLDWAGTPFEDSSA